MLLSVSSTTFSGVVLPRSPIDEDHPTLSSSSRIGICDSILLFSLAGQSYGGLLIQEVGPAMSKSSWHASNGVLLLKSVFVITSAGLYSLWSHLSSCAFSSSAISHTFFPATSLMKLTTDPKDAWALRSNAQTIVASLTTNLFITFLPYCPSKNSANLQVSLEANRVD